MDMDTLNGRNQTLISTLTALKTTHKKKLINLAKKEKPQISFTMKN